MGLTIHFEGKLASNNDFQKVMRCATEFAIENEIPYSPVDKKNAHLFRFENGCITEYESALKGVVLYPDPNSEPLFIQFDKDLYIRQFCKTVYADISVHIMIIDLLRKLRPFFVEFKVIDEGRYWETCDVIILQKLFDISLGTIDKLGRMLNG